MVFELYRFRESGIYIMILEIYLLFWFTEQTFKETNDQLFA